MTRLACTLGVLALGVGWPAGPHAQDARLVIATPRAGDYVSDRVPITVRVEPEGAASGVTEYAYYADGREICHVTPPAPATCEWDAGSVVKAHQIRVVATLSSGGRLVASVRTRALDVAERTSVRVVQVPVVVTDRDGNFVRQLPASAFALKEDGRPQQIAHFSDEEASLAVVLAFDLSESMSEALPALKSAVASFARRLPSTSHISLLAFNDDMFPVGQQGDSLERKLEILQNLQAFGGTALYDVIVRGLDDLGRARGRRALVVFTDGEDRASRATRAQVRDAVEASDASVYFVALGRGREVEPLLRGMEDLATLSGGRALSAEKPAELDARFGEVVADLAHQYLLGYTPTNAAIDGTWRKIDVALTTGKGLRLRARQGYRAPAAPK